MRWQQCGSGSTVMATRLDGSTANQSGDEIVVSVDFTIDTAADAFAAQFGVKGLGRDGGHSGPDSQLTASAATPQPSPQAPRQRRWGINSGWRISIAPPSRSSAISS